MTDPQPLPGSDRLACNCHYPIGLVVFLVFTIASLILCIFICCIDITKCSFYKRQKERPLLRRTSTFDPRFMDGPRIQRKFSVDPRLLASLDNGLSRQGSIVGPILPAVTHAECNGNLYGMYFPNEALVTTV
ncbi:unnamed protein product, partial [Mesorhabditis belari]|uniref:Uncharacterized protein n=1 Tax=Mesorhabditis belari TaxID=2138241 RepID=A0AAF3EVQ4_9BILA